MASVREFAFQNPGYVIGFVADNFVRNQLLNFLALPLSFELRDLETHVRELPYWPGWEGVLDPETYLLMLVNLLFVSIGLSVSWKKFRWLGLLPLFINFGFTFNLALARVSGWRYNLPIDWTVLLYYAMGIAQIVFWILLGSKNIWAKNFLNIKNYLLQTPESRGFLFRNLVAALIALTLLGSSFLIVEVLSKPRYTKLSDQEVTALIGESEISGTETERNQIVEMLAANEIFGLQGRALHPRFYKTGDGELDGEFLLVEPMDFNRITFYLIGPDPASVILPFDTPDISIPASSDVVVLFCGSSSIAAGVIVEHTHSEPQLYLSSKMAQACPQ
jgi:hypothetical protein